MMILATLTRKNTPRGILGLKLCAKSLGFVAIIKAKYALPRLEDKAKHG
jgi:hypothetical protein